MHSQFDEDDWIKDHLLLNISLNNKWCFEVGAADGREFSNTLWLREQGWQAALAESDEKLAATLIEEFGKVSDCQHRLVKSIDEWLDSTLCPENPDLGSIDVDGQDYWLLHDMELYLPRILIIEFSPYEDQVMEPYRGMKGQAAREPLLALARRKGYSCVQETYCNLILVQAELL